MEAAVAFHREAIVELGRVVETQDPAVWTAAVRPGKWSPAEIAQHLVLSYEVPLVELDGGAGFAIVLPWWKRAGLRWMILPRILSGRFPRGAPAPREARPRNTAASPVEAARVLREKAGLFERRLAEAHAERGVRLTHAYFGRLTAPQILTLLGVHATHHRAQFPVLPSGS
jgi:hypothetical protein